MKSKRSYRSAAVGLMLAAIVALTVYAPSVEAFGRRTVSKSQTSVKAPGQSQSSATVVKSRARVSHEPVSAASCDVSSGGYQQQGNPNDIAPVRSSASVSINTPAVRSPARVSAAYGSKGFAVCQDCGKWFDVATGEHLIGPPPQDAAAVSVAPAGQPGGPAEYLPPVSSQTVRVSADGKTGTVELNNVPKGSNIIVQPPGTVLPNSQPQPEADIAPAPRASAAAEANGASLVKTKSKAVSR